jgi:hypothetical protein
LTNFAIIMMYSSGGHGLQGEPYRLAQARLAKTPPRRMTREGVPKLGLEARVPDYRVYRGDLLLGELTRIGSDMPLWSGVFDPGPRV